MSLYERVGGDVYFFGLVECLLLQAKFAESKELINLGATRANSPDLIRAYARKLTTVLIGWADAKENDPRSTMEERLELLETALRLRDLAETAVSVELAGVAPRAVDSSIRAERARRSPPERGSV